MTEQEIEKVVNSEEFIKKLTDTESMEQAIALYAEYGISITPEELAGAIHHMTDGEEKNELSAEDLDNVAGGARWWHFFPRPVGLWPPLGWPSWY